MSWEHTLITFPNGNMPLVKGDSDLSEDDWSNIQSARTTQHEERQTTHLLRGRIRNTKKLLRTAALIMSVMLISSSFVTSILIPAEKFAEGGEANGRALAYLARHSRSFTKGRTSSDRRPIVHVGG